MLDKSPLDALLPCDECRHGTPLHDAGGCQVAQCRCNLTSDRIIDRALELAREEDRPQGSAITSS